jgi:hypothetical protein
VHVWSCRLPRYTRSAVLRRAVEPFDTVAVSDEWSIVMTMHYSHTVAACLHVLQTLTMLPARTSYRPMMALISGALEMYECAMGTCVPSCTGMTARLFFILEARGPQGAVGYVTAPELTSTERRGPEP